jgi:NADPH-dependent 2,4-dienoyl-CoA reductase/sulfur reductase-like enzyme
MNNERYNTLVIGAGPAGLAAAYTAAQNDQRVAIIDDNPTAGGQIWRGEEQKPSTPEAAEWLRKVHATKVEFIRGARVFAQPEAGLLLAEKYSGVCEPGYDKLILATGARERFLPFPGWTLPHVTGAGGLQALVKSGLPIKGQRVVVAGSGPLLVAVAAYLKKQGAEILLIAEQAPLSRLMKFGFGLLGEFRKALQALDLKSELATVPLLTGCWPVAAHGEGKLESVTLRRGRRTWDVACDYLACGFHLIPNLELAALLGCRIENNRVKVDDLQQTSVANVYCAGEATGIGGLDLSLIEGQIAGFAATGNHRAAEQLFAARTKAQRFADLLNQTFALREELKALPQPDTIICRCEDVTLARLQKQSGWRAAKLHTRCGMGPCQGRICGAAVEFLFGWQQESVRPPAFPVRMESLAVTIHS